MSSLASNEKSRERAKRFIVIGSSAFLLIAALTILLWPSTAICTICLLDADTKNKVVSERSEIIFIDQDEIALQLTTDSLGCVESATKQGFVTLIVSSPFYKTDTVVQLVDPGVSSVNVELLIDNYLLMKNYLENSMVEEWRERKRTLTKILADDAIIVQVDSRNKVAIEFLEKEDFVRKLLLPVRSLAQYQVAEVNYTNDKISYLRFYLVDESNPSE